MTQEPRMPLLHGEIRLEDTQISFNWMEHGRWNVEIVDVITGESAIRIWTNDQIAAVLALAVGGDEITFAESAYKIAEHAVSFILQSLRPIP